MKKEKPQPPNFYDFTAIAAANQKLAAQMLSEEPNWIHATSSTGETALHYLAVEGDTEAVKFLIDKGADVNTATPYGDTPLTGAAQAGHVETCLLLIEKGADVNAKDGIDFTAMHHAAKAGKSEILDALLAAGGRADAQGEYGDAVADVVLPRKRTLLLQVLAKYGFSETPDAE